MTRNILVLCGSSRRDSLNTRLARLVAEVRPTDRVSVITDLRHVPFYDGDLESAGVPPAVTELRAAVHAADLVVFVTPEYNGTVPGLLANAVDWLSRPPRQSALRDKAVLVLSASPTPYGGTRAAEHLRAVVARIGAAVCPTGLSVGTAHQRLGPGGPERQVASDLARLLEDALDSSPQPALA